MRKQFPAKYRIQGKIPHYKNSKWNNLKIPFDTDSTPTTYDFIQIIHTGFLCREEQKWRRTDLPVAQTIQPSVKR
uniref:Uncharacterized protein n=1 Tax=Lepeophtheirus salmonis TaxID=72036 RepID=A0A0K2THW7_LEPSM